MEISTETIKNVLFENLAPAVAEEILQKLEEAIHDDARKETQNESNHHEETGDTKEKEPKIDKKWVLIITEESLNEKEPVGYAVEMRTEDPVQTLAQKLQATAREFNSTKKGRKNPVHSLGDLFETVGPKFFKTDNVWKKTKATADVVILSNKLK
jgi:hypothetical protein